MQSIPVNINPEGKAHFSWVATEMLVDNILTQMHHKLYGYDRVVALGRGAMIPARLLARKEIPVFYEGVSSYEGGKAGTIRTNQHIGFDGLNNPRTLIVDDLWDTGETFRYAKRRWPEARTAALLSKAAAHELDFVGLVLPSNSWFTFPWER